MRISLAVIGCALCLLAAMPANADDDDAGDGTPLAANWIAFELNGKSVSGPTLDYAGDKVSGTGGCNRFNAPITVDDDAVQIGPVAATRMACADKAETEGQYFAALEAARSFSLNDGVLSLKAEGGNVILKFKK